MWRDDRRAVAAVRRRWSCCCGSARTSSAPAARSTPRRPAAAIPSPGSAKLADIPALALLGDTATLFTLPALIAALIAAVLGGRTVRLLAAGAAGWVAIVALMTTAGYAGNPRYLVAAAAIGAALAGVGVVQAASRVSRVRLVSGPDRRACRRPRSRPPPAPVLVAAVLAVTAGDLRDAGARAGLARRRLERVRRARSPHAGGEDALRALLADPHQHARPLARRLAAGPAAARPRRPPGAARGRDPREVVLRPGPRAAGASPATGRSSRRRTGSSSPAAAARPRSEPKLTLSFAP